ncbi:MAG TPA: FlgD immunoglobulin-like domain containing protein [bacterium]|nr:FlgD immunoglobulin-like domain containing protein [bacterium]HPR86658.1 FlgD immunoglobulin-like domain containing protein [bacterium]
MKKLILVLLLLAALGTAGAAITPIRDIQYTTDASGDSPLKGQVVTISGVVTGEIYAFKNSYFYVQDANAPWSGIKVYDKTRFAAQGDRVTLTGTVAEYKGVTEITTVTDFKIDSSGTKWIQPMTVTTAEIATGATQAEAYEGCLIRVGAATITNPSLGYGEWQIDDGTGPCRVDDETKYYFLPANYTAVQSVTGILDFANGDTKIEPRLADDVVEEGPYTRIQRIQQVRFSDLLATPAKNIMDKSYMNGDTVTVKGIVTMPTGLCYAGAGIKFTFEAPEGGPWSALLSYHRDSTAYPTLYEGDEIEMTGYLSEYTTAPSNMTEFFITSPINILDAGKPLPPVDSIKTGDLRWPTTAEQWGTVIVKVGNAMVTNLTPQYELFKVDDGSGAVLVDDESDSLRNYPDPALKSIFKSIEGWVYHHYGYYTDSTAYKLEPLFRSRVIPGTATLAIKHTARSTVAPTPAQSVTVTTTLDPLINAAGAKLYFKAGDGAYTAVEMSASSATYSAVIPAQPLNSLVSYYIEATDKSGNVSYDPPDQLAANYSYVVLEGNPTLAQIQYTPWASGDSPFQSCQVAVEGVITADTLFYSKYGAYPLQDVAGAWNGLYILGKVPALFRGDRVMVYGTVEDHNADYLYKWEGNTQIKADSVRILARGEALPAIVEVKTSELKDKSKSAESFEGVLVRINNATLTAVNSYDVTVDDGSGPCLLDADGFIGRDQDANPYFHINKSAQVLVVAGDTVKIGEQINLAQGVFLYSFGTHKIEIRDLGDIGTVTGVRNAVAAQPLTFDLGQNYPNPFNPETRLYFQLPVSAEVKLVIYNARGQIVRNLVASRYDAGHHVINWDGRDNAGNLAPTGVYIYRIKAGDYIAARKMTLVK